MDWLIRHQADLGLWVFAVAAIYLVLILIPLTARASWRSRLLLGTSGGAKLLSALIFSIPGMIFNLAVLIVAVGAAAVWLLQPVPRLHGIEPLTSVHSSPDADRLLLYVGGRLDPAGTGLLGLLARDPRLEKVDILAVDIAAALERREPRLIELAQAFQPAVHAALTDPKYKAVVLVGHGIGGLLVRWWAAPDGEAKQVPPVRALLDLAVPKKGADLAALGRALGLAPVLLAEVNDQTGFAGAAQRRWHALEGSAGSAYCVYGDADTAVPRDSAMHNCARRDDVVGADHRSIAAPADREALGYRRPARLIADALAR
jgi:hypothetical protein